MKVTGVKAIKAAIHQQAMKGTRRVQLNQSGYRVIDARTVKGQLQVRTIGGTSWQNVDSVTIN